jgi:hypothetical protein
MLHQDSWNLTNPELTMDRPGAPQGSGRGESSDVNIILTESWKLRGKGNSEYICSCSRNRGFDWCIAHLLVERFNRRRVDEL